MFVKLCVRKPRALSCWVWLCIVYHINCGGNWKPILNSFISLSLSLLLSLALCPVVIKLKLVEHQFNMCWVCVYWKKIQIRCHVNWFFVMYETWCKTYSCGSTKIKSTLNSALINHSGYFGLIIRLLTWVLSPITSE